MIPKVIHYCWFGRKELPPLAVKCIRSWKKFLPDYKIVEWNEDNFDIYSIPYVKEAYEAKRYAFVSDYARFYILYRYGGVYFDTDVEIIKPIDDILERGAYMGFETPIGENIPLYVNPGLGLATEPGNRFLGILLDLYSRLHFINPDGTHNLKTIVQYTSDILIEHGLQKTSDIQCVDNIWIYPKEYFNPYDCVTDKIELTENTRSIHYFAASWKTRKERFMKFIEDTFGQRGVGLVHRIYVLIFKKSFS